MFRCLKRRATLEADYIIEEASKYATYNERDGSRLSWLLRWLRVALVDGIVSYLSRGYDVVVLWLWLWSVLGFRF